MSQKRIKPNDKKNFAAGLSVPKSVAGVADGLFHISLKHLDRNQGQRFHDWQENGMLAEAMETLFNLSHLPIDQQLGKKFTCYGDFPAKEKTEFTHPKHVPDDAKWARIHVNGTHIIAGHIFKNTFYVVFLDAHHKFYISELKNT
ncbi:MAG: hypothetical protein JWP12_2542 [Bacteroidetes bacterium]|nr:hypothetical protein [Bacteroidota bacterium]